MSARNVQAKGSDAGPLISLIAGGTAGGVECAVTYPFEFAKTRVQLRWDAAKDGPPNPFKVVARVYATEGVGALYMGCSTLIIGTIGKDALRFLTFDYVRNIFKDPETGKLTPLRGLFSGMCAGVVASIGAVTPTERIKTALIDDAKNERRFNGPIDAVKQLMKEGGIMAVYRGFWGTTLKQASTTAVRLGSYNMIKDAEEKANIKMNPGINFLNGSVVGAITVFTTQPFDVIKTRTQSVKAEGMVDATRGIYQDYGIKGYWKGSSMRLGRNVFSGAILFSVYEEIAAILAPMFGAEKPSHH